MRGPVTFFFVFVVEVLLDRCSHFVREALAQCTQIGQTNLERLDTILSTQSLLMVGLERGSRLPGNRTYRRSFRFSVASNGRLVIDSGQFHVESSDVFRQQMTFEFSDGGEVSKCAYPSAKFLFYDIL